MMTRKMLFRVMCKEKRNENRTAKSKMAFHFKCQQIKSPEVAYSTALKAKTQLTFGTLEVVVKLHITLLEGTIAD